jgi:hypothetical protein
MSAISALSEPQAAGVDCGRGGGGGGRGGEGQGVLGWRLRSGWEAALQRAESGGKAGRAEMQ